MPGIANMIDLIGKLDGAYVTVRQERCVLVRNRNADCLRCADACTSGCIHFDGECLSIDPSAASVAAHVSPLVRPVVWKRITRMTTAFSMTACVRLRRRKVWQSSRVANCWIVQAVWWIGKRLCA